MKESYIYKDGNIIITDVKKTEFTDNIIKKEKRPYQDNIDEILINENMIEDLQNLKDNINFDIENNQSYIKDGKSILKISIPIVIFATLIFLAITNIILNNIMQASVLSLLITSTVLSPPLIYGPIKTIKESKKTIKIHEFERNEIEKKLKQLIKENKELEEIKTRDKEKTLKENDFKHLNYKNKLTELREFLAMIAFYEMCKEQLTKYDEQGILEEKLKDELDGAQMKTLRRIINTKSYKRNEF